MRNTHISYHYYALELFFCGAHIEITNRSQQIILAARERETEGKLKQSTDTRLTLAQQFLSDRWDEHVRGEFATKDAAAALDTMVPDAYVNHV